MRSRKTADSDSYEQPNTARRALLTGSAVGLAAVAGSVLGQSQPASAAVNEPTPDWINVTNPAYAGGAVGDGSHDDTAAIQAAAAAVPAGGVLYFPVGTYKTTGTINLGFDQRMMGDGGGSMIQYHGSGDAVRQHNPSAPPYPNNDFAGGVEDIVIDGSSSTGAACGLHIGDGSDYYLNRVRISNFQGTGAIGMHLDNTTGWTEKMTATVQLFRNTTAVVFDVNPTMGSATPSFMYNDFDFHISVSDVSGQGQQGIKMLNGAFIQNARLKVRGNFFFNGATSFTGVSCLDISGTGCYISGSFLDIAVETDFANPGQTGWQTIKFGSNNIRNNNGLLIFSDPGWTTSDATLASGQFSFNGIIQNEPTLIAANAYNPASSGAVVSGQLLCPVTNYAPSTQATLPVSSSTLTPFDTTHITTGAFSAPPSGNVLVTASFMGLPSTTGQYVAFGLLGHTSGALRGNVQEPRLPATSAVVPITLQFFMTGLTPGQSYQFDLAGAVASGSFTIDAIGQASKTPTLGAAGAGGPVVLTVAAA